MPRANRYFMALEFGKVEALRTAHREWVDEALRTGSQGREEFWSRSLAVGSAEFVLKAQESLGVRGRYRDIADCNDMHVLRGAE